MTATELPTTDTPRPDRCETCRFWTIGEYRGCADYEGYDHDTFGACKRFPHEEEKFGTDWCGEWKAKDEAAWVAKITADESARKTT